MTYNEADSLYSIENVSHLLTRHFQNNLNQIKNNYNNYTGEKV